MKSKTFLPLVITIGLFASSSLWAVGSESSSSRGHVSSRVSATMAADNAEGGLAQILTSLALVLVLVSKRVSG